MPSQLRRLCYFSRSLIQGTSQARSAEIERLLSVARIVNARFGLTGMLLASEDCFAQILEGPPDAVGTMYERIERDWRHTGMTLLHDQPVAERAFAGWAMASATNLSWPQLTAARPGPLYEKLAGILSQTSAA